MSDLYQAIADRLRVTLTTAADVQAATSAAEIDHAPLGPVPTVLVVPSGERWTAPREAGLYVSTSGLISFACVVGLTTPGGSAEWTAVREQIRGALLGWSPSIDEAAGPVFAAGARLLSWSSDQGGRWLHSFDFSLPAQASYGVQT